MVRMILVTLAAGLMFASQPALANPVRDLREALPVDPLVGWCAADHDVWLKHSVIDDSSLDLPDGSILAYDLLHDGDIGIFNPQRQVFDEADGIMYYVYRVVGYSRDSDCLEIPGEDMLDPEFELVECIEDVAAVHLPNPPPLPAVEICLDSVRP